MKGWPCLSLNILKPVFVLITKLLFCALFEVFRVSHCQVHQRAPSLRNEKLVSKGSKVTAEAGGRAGISQGSSLTPADPTLPLAEAPVTFFLGGGQVWHSCLGCVIEMGVGKVCNGAAPPKPLRPGAVLSAQCL